MTKWSPCFFFPVCVARNFNSFIDVKPRSQCFASRFVSSYPIHKSTWSRSHHNNSFILSSSPAPWVGYFLLPPSYLALPFPAYRYIERKQRKRPLSTATSRSIVVAVAGVSTAWGIVLCIFEMRSVPLLQYRCLLLLFPPVVWSFFSGECACEATQEIHS